MGDKGGPENIGWTWTSMNRITVDDCPLNDSIGGKVKGTIENAGVQLPGASHFRWHSGVPQKKIKQFGNFVEAAENLFLRFTVK
ncbi:hypothetical protein RUM43_006947 [Polyplax serrata]|uniref:Uncharacterized protein n=1 Tax=Polyplax serrata TaxID=468196 RepID=A0AAN8P4V1_POLSC